MREIASGDYTHDVTGIDRGDEVGTMAKAVRVFRENGIAKDAADTAKARSDAEQKMVVDTVSTHLSELSAGDLTAAIKTDFPPEYGALKSNFNEALDNLRGLIGSVTESATTIRTGSGEIAQASEDLARRTESNAASLEETAASVTQMDGRLKASATASTKTVERADQAIATVGGGRAVADEAVQAMGRVSESAKGIDSVIEGLDKIAFQTRVLAMNAAVEAGRAGDAGRGFAVVADLVSALAMRAEEEAKRARDQLTVTQTDIVTAVEAVQKVDGALANISGDVGQVHALLATMAADNQAQSAAITQISAAIGTMDQLTVTQTDIVTAVEAVQKVDGALANISGDVGQVHALLATMAADNQAQSAAITQIASARRVRDGVDRSGRRERRADGCERRHQSRYADEYSDIAVRRSGDRPDAQDARHDQRGRSSGDRAAGGGRRDGHDRQGEGDDDLGGDLRAGDRDRCERFQLCRRHHRGRYPTHCVPRSYRLACGSTALPASSRQAVRISAI